MSEVLGFYLDFGIDYTLLSILRCWIGGMRECLIRFSLPSLNVWSFLIFWTVTIVLEYAGKHIYSLKHICKLRVNHFIRHPVVVKLYGMPLGMPKIQKHFCVWIFRSFEQLRDGRRVQFMLTFIFIVLSRSLPFCVFHEMPICSDHWCYMCNGGQRV